MDHAEHNSFKNLGNTVSLCLLSRYGYR